jgi:PST family polysaccharide transporter
MATPSHELPETATELVPRMLKVTAALGLSSVAVVAFTIGRSKLVALQLGPRGIGALALLTSFVTLAALVVQLGMGNSAIREIATASSDSDERHRDQLRRALYVTTFALAAVGAVVIALAAEPIASGILGDRGLTGEVRLGAISAFATACGAAALADLTAFRRMRAIALLEPLAALLATLVAVGAFAADVNLVGVVLVAPPVALAVVGLASARSLPRPRRGTWSLRDSRRLVSLGIAFVLNAGVAALGALLVRILINGELGQADTGQFQAAYAVAFTYVGFMFTALATDYLPLLSSLDHDRPRLNQAANTQLLVALLIATPAVMALIAAASFVVPVLYSGAFHDTAQLLRIMLVGELARVAAWTIGYILIARAARTLFVVTELLYNALLIGAVAALVPALGLDGTAIAYLVGQMGSLGWTLVFVRRASGFALSRANVLHLIGLAAGVAIVFGCATGGTYLQVVGWVLVGAFSFLALRRLADLAGVGLGRLGTLRPRDLIPRGEPPA